MLIFLSFSKIEFSVKEIAKLFMWCNCCVVRGWPYLQILAAQQIFSPPVLPLTSPRRAHSVDSLGLLKLCLSRILVSPCSVRVCVSCALVSAE